MESKVTGTAVQSESGCAFIGIIGTTHFSRTSQLFWYRVRDTPGVYIDHTADSATAVQQGAGPLQHFNALSNKRFNHSHVVWAGYRHIKTVNPILHNLDPRSAETSNNRPTDGLAKSG